MNLIWAVLPKKVFGDGVYSLPVAVLLDTTAAVYEVEKFLGKKRTDTCPILLRDPCAMIIPPSDSV